MNGGFGYVFLGAKYLHTSYSLRGRCLEAIREASRSQFDGFDHQFSRRVVPSTRPKDSDIQHMNPGFQVHGGAVFEQKIGRKYKHIAWRGFLYQVIQFVTGWLSDLFKDQSDFQLVTRGWKGPFESPGRDFFIYNEWLKSLFSNDVCPPTGCGHVRLDLFSWCFLGIVPMRFVTIFSPEHVWIVL